MSDKSDAKEVLCTNCGCHHVVDGTCANCGGTAVATIDKTFASEEWHCDCGKSVFGTNICPFCKTILCKCGRTIDGGSDHCECGKKHCVFCGSETSEGDVFCGHCGIKLIADPPIPAPADVLGKDFDRLNNKQKSIAKKLGLFEAVWNGTFLPVTTKWAKMWAIPFDDLRNQMPYEHGLLLALGFTAENWGKPITKYFTVELTEKELLTSPAVTSEEGNKH